MIPALWLACATASPPAVSDLNCLEEPVATWENVGAGLILENCQSCHASGAVNRYGAPQSVVFDTEAQVLALRDRVLIVTHPDTRSMPPALALSDADRHLLEVWLTCWE